MIFQVIQCFQQDTEIYCLHYRQNTALVQKDDSSSKDDRLWDNILEGRGGLIAFWTETHLSSAFEQQSGARRSYTTQVQANPQPEIKSDFKKTEKQSLYLWFQKVVLRMIKPWNHRMKQDETEVYKSYCAVSLSRQGQITVDCSRPHPVEF